MRFVLLAIGAFAASALAVAAAHENQSETDVQIKSTQVAGTVYMLEGQGGNIGACVGEDGILIVDDQFARLAEKIRAALTELNPGPIQFILNTHHHGDHVGGNPVFGKEGTIIAHENVFKRVTAPQKRGDRTIEPLERSGWPVVTFEDNVHIHFNGEDIRFIHLPAGHTDGDAIVYFPKADVVHMGDLLFTGHFPFIDTEGGGTVEGYMKNLAWVMFNMPATAQFIPGHGPLATMDDVKAMHTMIRETSAMVKKLVAEKKTLAEIKAAGIPEEFKSYEWEFVTGDKWLETLYAAYSK